MKSTAIKLTFFIASLFFLACAEESDAIIREVEEYEEEINNPEGPTDEEEGSEEEGNGDDDDNNDDGSDDDGENSDDGTDAEEPEITGTSPCAYDDLGIESGDTVEIECLLDLEGRTISVPSNVTFKFEGGDIFNGTLNFSSGGKIDGPLLNSKLALDGDVQLTSEEFIFVPSRWEIVEIQTSDNSDKPSTEVAFNNHVIIQSTIDLVNNLGANTFSIGKMNAFFDSLNGKSDYVAAGNATITMPSNFNLRMSDETFLRVLPVSSTLSTVLIRVFKESNITISGGHLIGDRLEHGPVDGGAVLLVVRGGKNVTIDGTSISLSNHSGLTVNSNSFLERADYFGSENITIRNCTFDANRTNNLSVTDGQNITIEGNKSYRAGVEMSAKYGTSEGVAPRIGILVETQVMQYVEDVIIRGNIVEESVTLNSILAVGATDILIANNTADRYIGWTTAINVEVTNNDSGGITGGFNSDEEQFKGFNNVISNNRVTNEDGTGIFITNQNVEVYNNRIINCSAAFQLSSLTNATIYDNVIESNVDNSIGVIGQNYLNNVVIRDNSFNLSDGKPLNIFDINNDNEHSEYFLTFQNNSVKSTQSALMPGSKNIILDGNEFNGAGIGISGCDNITVLNNKVLSSIDSPPFAIADSENITVKGNSFETTSTSPFAIGVKFTQGSNLITNDAKVLFQDNSVKALDINYGMFVSNYNGVTILDNYIENESAIRPALFFTGNDAEIRNNELVNKTRPELLSSIDGARNIIENN